MTLPFQTIDWSMIPKIIHAGETGVAHWQTVQLANLRVRLVDYSAGYLADHWCCLGHIVHCLEGELGIEMQSGEQYLLKAGMSYIVSDDLSTHRSHTTQPVKLIIVDGDFLKSTL
jgi:mannose-6-phosphate isomerase class I